MSFYVFSALLNGVAATVLGLLIYSKAADDSRRRTYGLYCLSLSIWSYCYVGWQLAETRPAAMAFVRLLMVGAILIPIFYFHHTATILSLVERHRTWIRAGYVTSALFLILVWTPYFIADLQPEMSFRYWPKPGPAFHPYLVWFGANVAYATYLMAKASRQSTGLRRNQYLYLLTGTLIGYTGGATNFPLWYGVQVPPVGTIFVTVYTAIVAYTLIQYRLLDFSAVIEKGLTYLLLLIFLAIPSYAVILQAQKTYFGEVSVQFSVLLLCLFVLLVTAAYQVKSQAQVAVARTLFRRRYDMYDTLSAFSKALVTILDFRSLTSEIVRTLTQVMGITTASLYVLEKEKDLYILSASHGLDMETTKRPPLRAGDDLPRHLAAFQTILVREELEEGVETASRAILDILRVMESEVCIPLINKDRLIGFCNLGQRASLQMFSEDDLKLLTTLAQHAAIALDNAMLYEDLKRSQTLMRRTDRLRSLEIIAGGFAHEIRNPLTSIKTFIQLAPERKDDLEFINHFSKVVSEDVDRIERLIQEILDYARYMEPKFAEEDINDIVTSCLYFIEVKADSKSVAIKKQLAHGLPPLLLDRQQIKQVLLNLFLNAMEAMGEAGGALTVRTHRLIKDSPDPWVQIEIVDTGSGIAPADLEHIFDPFFTTKHESGEREGTGLGLTIVHQIVQEHRGYIEVESSPGKGTAFYVNLPGNPLHLEPHKDVEHEKTGLIGR